ncbi:hypothetical protein D3C87_2104870 [compost metagenome]
MGNSNAQGLVALHQRESRAWDVQPFIISNCPDDSAGKRGFSRPQIAGKRDKIALLQGEGEILAETLCCSFVGQEIADTGL